MITIKFNRTYDSYAGMINGIFQHCVVVFSGKHPGSKDEEVYKESILTALDDFTKQNNKILQKHKDGIFASTGSDPTSYSTALQKQLALYFAVKPASVIDAYSSPNSLFITWPCLSFKLPSCPRRVLSWER